MPANHDARYKRFFSNPILLRELLESFVHEGFIHDLDFSTLKRVDKSYVTEEFRERESDLIHEIRYQDSKIYIFLLIEFQSKVDRLMPLRFLRYLCEFYESLARSHKLGRGQKLPAVFPLLLYNGSRRWTAPAAMQDLIDEQSNIHERFIPHFEYCLVDENSWSTDTLVTIRNTVAALFLAEKTPEDRLSDIDLTLYTLVQDEDHGAARELFLWLRNVLGDDRQFADELPELASIEEEHTMLAETIRKHDKKIYAEGRQEGHQVGRLEGEAIGLKRAALRLKDKGHSREEIARLLELPLDQVP
jgi:predicted transposase/invertase (TIGR01784 family)